MLGSTFGRAQLASVLGLLYSCGLQDGSSYAAWSDDNGASNYEDPYPIEDGVTAETPALTLGAGGEWLTALVLNDQVVLKRSQDHCATWASTQTLT